MGGAIGAGLDKALGTNTPNAVLQRAAALRLLNRTNTPTPPNPIADLQAVQSAAADRPVYTPAPTVDVVAANKAASAAYGVAQERDGNAVARDQANAARLKQQQIDAAYQQAQAASATPAPTADPDFIAALSQVGLPPNPTDAYLAGKGSSDGTAPVASQTAAEIATYAQMQRNRAAALADAQRAVRVGQLAINGDPQVAGQAAVDAASRRNAVTLAASDAVPSYHPGVSPTASIAAMTTAQRAADRVRAMSGEEPVGSGVTQPPRTPTDALQPSLAPSVADAPALTPADSVGLPAGTPTPQPQTAPSWVKLIQREGPGIGLSHIDQAIDGAVAAGEVTPQMGAAIRAAPGHVPLATLKPIAVRAAALAASDLGAVGLTSGGFGPAPADPTVRRPAAYLYATQSYQAQATALAEAAQAALGPEGKAAVITVAHAHGPDKATTLAAKLAAKARVLAALPGVAPYLPDSLMNHGQSK